MRKRVLKAYMKRTLAFLLTAVMVFSTVDSASLFAYATSGSDVVVTEITEEMTSVVETMEETVFDVEEVTTEENSETIESTDETTYSSEEEIASTEEMITVEDRTEEAILYENAVFAVNPMAEGEENGEVSAYNGTIRTEGDYSVLEISAYAMENNSIEVTEENIIAILGAQEQAFDIVEINMSSITDSISKELWNTVVGVLVQDEEAYTSFRYNQAGDVVDVNWCFDSPREESSLSQISIGVTFSIGAADEGFTVNFVKNAYSCSGTCVNFATDENRTSYEEILTAIGTNGNQLKLYENDETEVEYFNICKESYTFTEDGVDKQGINFSLRPMEYLTSNVDYTVKKSTYSGQIEPEGTLQIHMMYLDEYSDKAVIDILETRKAAGESYEEIYLGYDEVALENNALSEEVWNAAQALLIPESEEGKRAIGVRTLSADEGYKEWIFYQATTTDADVVMKENLTFSEEEMGGATISFDNTTFPADHALFKTDARPEHVLRDMYYRAFGTENTMLAIYDKDGKRAESDFGRNVSFDARLECAGLYMNMVNEYTAGETYTLTLPPYAGDENDYTDEEGMYHHSLYLHPGNIDQESFTVEQVRTMMETYDTRTFDEVTLVFCSDDMGGTVDADYINVIKPYLMDYNYRQTNLRITFQHTTTHEEISWVIGNPEEQTEDQTLTASFTITENIPALQVSEQSFIAEYVNMVISRSNEVDEDGVFQLKEIFGSAPTEISVGELEIAAGFDFDDFSAWIWIDDLSKLNANETYTLLKKAYKGTVENRDDIIQKALMISYQDAGVESLSKEEILDILGYYSDAGEKFDSIEISNPETETLVIDKDIVNAAAALFNTEGDVERPLSFRFVNEENHIFKCWALINPTPNQEADQTVTSSLTISEDNKVEVQASECKFSADKYQMIFSYGSDSENYRTLREKFPFDDDSWTMLAIGEEAFGAFMPNQYRADIVVYIDPDTVWSAEKVYEVNVAPYTGHINEWDDGTKELWIGFEEAGVESFTEEQLNGILDNYSTEDGIGAIYIEQPRLENNPIYKTVADKAAVLIAGDYGEVRFGFKDTNTEQCVEWRLFGNPAMMVQTADQNVNAGIYISVANEEHGDELVLSVSEQSLVAENVSVHFFTNRQNELETADDYIIGLFGWDEIPLETAGGEVEGWYSVDEWNVCMGFHNPGALTPGEGYTIIKKEYRGDVWEEFDENGDVISTTLHVNSDMVGLDTWTIEAFENTVQYWVDRGITFDCLNIEQKYTDNNVIQKDILNASISLLSNSDAQRVEFVFCQCIMEECDEEGNITQEYSECDYLWILNRPKTATKDINANVKFDNKNGAGLSVVLPANTYVAEQTDILLRADNRATIYNNVFVPVFGYPVSPDDSDFAGQLLVLEDGKNLKFDDYARYDAESQYANLYLSNIEEWTVKIDNRLIRPIHYGGLASVGKTIALPFFGNFNPNNPNEDYTPANNGKFTLLTPDVATLTGDQFTATVPDKIAYTLFSYTSVKNEPCLEVLRISTVADIFGLSFMKDSHEIIWNGSEVREGYLEVKVLPSSIQNHINPQDFEWDIVSGDSIVLKEKEYETYYDEETGEDVILYRKNGDFTVVGYGETVVQVSYGDYSATCTVNVMAPVQIPDIPVITAIPAVDVTLGDVDVDALIKETSDNTFEGTFTWQEPTTKLASFADNGWHTFGATYTVEGREPVPMTICVDMLKIENIEIWDMEKDENGNFVLDEPGITCNSILVGDEIVYGFRVNTNRMDGANIYGDSVLQRYVENGDIVFKWTDKQTLNLLDAEHELNDIVGLARSYTADKKGKKTFKIAAVNTKTNKVIASNSVTVLVTEKDLFSFDYERFVFGDNEDPDSKMKGTYTIFVDSQNYANAKKLTIKSGDTSVLKLGRISVIDADKSVSGMVEITIPYEFKKYGETVLKIAASDEAKTSKVIPVERVDYEPRPSLDSFTIDKSWSIEGEYQPETILNIAFQHDTLPTGIVTIKETEYRELFVLDGSVEDAWYKIKLANANVDNGTYNLTLQIPYSIDGEEQTPVEKVIKVKVQESKVKVKVKQTKKVNEFYDLTATSEGDGILTVDSGKAQVIDAWISNENSVFELNRIGVYDFTIGLKDGVDLAGEKMTAEQKNVQVTYSVLADNGAEHENTVNITVTTENKAPQLVLSLKNETLYPVTGQYDAVVQILDKKTKEPVDVTGCISLVDKNSDIITDIVTADKMDESPYEYLTIGKNKYFIYNNFNEISYYLYDSQKAVKSSDKVVLRVQREGWNGCVDLNYTIKVDLSVPKVILDNKTLTLNANNDLYLYQIARTPIKIKNHSDFPYVENGWVTGANAKSNAVLKNNLNIYVMEDMLVARIVDKGNEADVTALKNGSYKFKVWTVINGQKYSTDLTVKIVDKEPSKVVNVTKKGSIDVLRRGSTQITLNPKFNNVSGELRNFWLIGPDANMFDAYIDENGNCVVKVKENCEDEYGNPIVFNYSTKHNYQVKPVYELEDWMTGPYKVEGSLQKIKVTQGKPKVTVDCSTNALYGDKSFGALFTFDAMLKDEHIAIESVELLNYTEDLIWDSENNILQVNTDVDPVEITKASGKYTIKFAITYMDAAGNEKATQVSYKLNIVR